MKAAQIIKAGMASKTITNSERNKLKNMQIHVPEYVEPGYTTEKACVVLGDYNPTSFENPGDFGRVCDLLEKIAELEWEDEWTTCSDCGKLVRTSRDCYQWTPHYAILNDCELVCLDCLDEGDYLAEIANDATKACMPSIDPTIYGWELEEDHFENGLHKGMNDKPENIAKKIPSDKDFVFKLDETSQFYITFSVYTATKKQNSSKLPHFRGSLPVWSGTDESN